MQASLSQAIARGAIYADDFSGHEFQGIYAFCEAVSEEWLDGAAAMTYREILMHSDLIISFYCDVHSMEEYPGMMDAAVTWYLNNCESFLLKGETFYLLRTKPKLVSH